MPIKFLNDVAVDTSVLFVDTINNRVGIGTTSPGEKLHVQAADPSILIKNTTFGSGESTLVFQTAMGAKNYLAVNSSNALNYKSTSGSSIFTIENGGDVGIGTTSPGTKLDVNGNNGTAIRISIPQSSPSLGDVLSSFETFSNDTSGGLSPSVRTSVRTITEDVYARNMGLSFGTSGADGENLERMRISNSGNVGIGTTSPSAKLTVVDDILLTGSSPSLTLTDASSSFVIKTNTAGEGILQTSGTSKPIRFFRNNGSNESMRIDGAGNVGIGTTSPGQKLEVEGNIRLSKSNDVTSGFELGRDGSTLDAFIIQRENADLFFRTNNSEKMRIAAGGNVGIGTTSPAYLLDVNEDDNVLAFRVTGGGGGAPMASFVRDVGATGSQVNINAQSNFPQIQFTNTGNTFSIGGDTSGNFKISDNTSIGTNDRITIDNTGNVGIGTTSPSQKLHVNGSVQANIYYMSGTSTSILNFFSYIDLQASNGVLVRSGSTYKPITASAFTVSSDYRLKSNIEPLENAIDRLNQLEVRRFNWNDRLDEPKVDGFIAHEVAPIIPEAVLGEKDAVYEDGTPNHQGIDQAKIVPLLTAALQEAISKIENLEARIQILENQ